MIVQNLLPDFLAAQIKEQLCGKYFPWFCRDYIIVEDAKDEPYSQFNHIFYGENQIQSEYYQFIEPALACIEKEINIKIKSILRIKTNLTTRWQLTEDEIKTLFHKDQEEDRYLSLIYYVNDSDGDTIIRTKDDDVKVTPKSNKACYFKSNTLHAGMFPQISKKRIVINFVLELEEI
jgi:hypothetical protein